MNWTDWESIKENLKEIYGKAARFMVFYTLLLYLWSCVISGQPVGPVRFVGFLYHCSLWRVKDGF